MTVGMITSFLIYGFIIAAGLGSLVGALAETLEVNVGVSLGAGLALMGALGLWAWLRRAQRPAPFPVGRLQG